MSVCVCVRQESGVSGLQWSGQRVFRGGLCVGKKNASFHFLVSYETIMGVASVVWCNNGA